MGMANPQEFSDYYGVLKVERTADLTTIKQAYRRLARQLHPDLNPHDEAAAARFKGLNQAYEVLSDPLQRRHYDRYGTPPKPGRQNSSYPTGPSSSPQDDFEELEFGRHGSFEDLLGDLLERYR